MFSSLKKKEAQFSKNRRFKKTLDFISHTLPSPAALYDVGTPNELGAFLSGQGYTVSNTRPVDLDLHPEAVGDTEAFDAVTAFEILEHLLNPFGVLCAIKARRLFVSVPLRLWYSKAYRHKNDEWDRHFHEFEDWQFDWLLQKSGWQKVRSEKWTNPAIIPGFRPLLRLFTPRYYVVEAQRT